jgi:transcriptional regulator with XRE-family HTH domain/DNA polymerase III delta prime subunit
MERVPNLLLQRARQEQNLTQRQLADLVGVTEQAIQSWESGKRQSPSPVHRGNLCEVLGKTPQDLGLLPAEQSPRPDLAQPSEQKFLFHHQVDMNRRRMVGRVRSIWIDGVLKASIHQAVLITLGLQDQPDALANPWRLAVQETDLPPSPLPAGTSIMQVYDEATGELLILGEPGAGKTTLLLELARTLLEAAEESESEPIPVVFNLSSWATKQLPLEEWLVEELQSKYDVPEAVAMEWVRTNQLILLLDGLDEVAEVARLACVKGILAYKQQDPLVALVICCRSAEYFALSTRMRLQRAVSIEPLSKEQIDLYLSHAGSKLEIVKKALSDDLELFSLVQSPLLLSIVALAYQGKQSPLVLSGSATEQRQQIFRTYVQRMLARRGVTSYGADQTTCWLTFLAQQMQQHNQTVFYLERLQPNWLPDPRTVRRYRLAVHRFVFGLIIVLDSALFACFRGDSFPTKPGLFFWLGGGSGNRVLGWMAPGLGSGLQGSGSLGILFAIVAILVRIFAERRKIPALSRKALVRGLARAFRWGGVVGSFLGVFSGFLFAHLGGLAYGLFRGIGIALFAGLLVGLVVGLTSLLREEAAKEDGEPYSLRERLLSATLFCLCATLGFTSLFALQSGGISPLALSFGLIVGCFHAVVFGIGKGAHLIPGLGRHIRPAEIVTWSWQAVGKALLQTVSKGALLGLAILVSVVFSIACISSLLSGIAYGLRYGVIYGVIVGLIAAVASILTGMLTSGWESSMLDEKHLLVRPNEGIRRSLKNALFAAGLFGPIGGMASGLLSGLAFGLGGIAGWPVLGTGFLIVFGLIFACQFLLHYGGIAVIEHYQLRWYLWRKGVMPWNCVAFLEQATERILLRKVGGGYMFIHRLLLEYFASDQKGEN